MQKSQYHAYLIIFCFSITLFSTASIWWIDSPIINGKTVSISTQDGYSLVGTYYSGTNPIGIIFLEGFGSDQIMLKPLVSEFAEWGASMLTFDFSGHGRSPSSITFNNAASDRLALEVLAAKNKFKELSGLNDDQIFMIGHSMGARMALWASILDLNPVKGLILMGCQVNLIVNTQASFFTGVDDRDLPWIESLNQNMPSTDIMLITGEWDDILTPTSAEALKTQLEKSTIGSIYSRDLFILPRLVHNYEIYSPRVVELSKNWMKDRVSSENPLELSSLNMKWRVSAWIISLISLFVGLGLFANYGPLQTIQNPKKTFEITNVTVFLKKKILLWGLALPIMALLLCAFVFLPLGQPIFNLIYVGFISAYGLTLYWKYRKGSIAGTSGFLLDSQESIISDASEQIDAPIKKYIHAIMSTLFLMINIWAFARSGWFYVFPLNQRLIWLIIFTPFSALGFFISQYEYNAIENTEGVKQSHKIALTLIGLFPFILFSLLFWILGSLSGMIGGLQGLVILLLVIYSGNILNNKIRNPRLVALIQGFWLQLLVLPSTALFRF